MNSWIPVSERFPDTGKAVAVLATNPHYCFGHAQPLVGYFKKEYYGTTVNRFNIIGGGSWNWTVTHWCDCLPSEVAAK